jgi:hypothetical protein
MQAIAGKPLVVTEYNHSAPNTYGAETFPLVAAYAALQDWDAVFAYSYTHANQPWEAGRFVNNFDIARHTVKMVTLPHAAALFLRGDVATPASVHETEASEEQFRDLTRQLGVNLGAAHFGASRMDALRRPQRLRLGAPAPVSRAPEMSIYGGPIISDGGELTWDAQAPRGRFLVNTPRSKAVIGFTDEENFTLGTATIHPGRSRQGWSAILLTQMEGSFLGQPGRALLTACGDTENTGMVWANPSKTSVKSWGDAPVLVEGINAEITLLVGAGKVEVWALDEKGQRHRPVPTRGDGTHATFSIGPEYRTLWYEIVVTSPHTP